MIVYSFPKHFYTVQLYLTFIVHYLCSNKFIVHYLCSNKFLSFLRLVRAKTSGLDAMKKLYKVTL